jgi:hypothetical protein
MNRASFSYCAQKKKPEASGVLRMILTLNNPSCLNTASDNSVVEKKQAV